MRSGRAPALLVAALLLGSGCASAAGPEPGPPERQFPLLVAAGDIACPPGAASTPRDCQQEATATLVEGLAPTAVLALGDTQYERAQTAEYASYDRSWGRFRDITHPVVGNHEYLSGDADDYFAYFGDRAGKPDQGWYSLDIGAWHVVVLNSQCGEIDGCDDDSPQVRWLAADLTEHPARCTLAAWHEPRFSSGAEHGDEDAVAPLWELLDQAGADVVLSGHEHVYERFAPQSADGRATPDGVVQFVVGTGGEELREVGTVRAHSQARSDAAFGVLALTLRPDGYDWRFVGTPGAAEVDSGSAGCI